MRVLFLVCAFITNKQTNKKRGIVAVGLWCFGKGRKEESVWFVGGVDVFWVGLCVRGDGDWFRKGRIKIEIGEVGCLSGSMHVCLSVCLGVCLCVCSVGFEFLVLCIVVRLVSCMVKVFREKGD